VVPAAEDARHHARDAEWWLTAIHRPMPLGATRLSRAGRDVAAGRWALIR
jgi:hypothetical protein